jgi:hypothetical protein
VFAEEHIHGLKELQPVVLVGQQVIAVCLFDVSMRFSCFLECCDESP